MAVQTRFLASKLINKSILRVYGPDSLSYLQTFLTNDIRHVAPGSGRHCLYSHIINSMGRTLADVFLYQPTISPQDPSVQRNLILAPFFSDDFGQGGLETDQVLIESSKSMTDALQRTLFAMKIRKNVSFEQVPDRQVWVIFPEDYSKDRSLPQQLQVSQEFLLVNDPRLPDLAYRLVAPSSWNANNVRNLVGPTMEIQRCDVAQYETFRYRLGISEGVKEHAEGFLFPLECNADLLNGISFKKGMFSGDWITGRNYRKGVQARIVPFEIGSSKNDESKLDQVAPDSSLIDPETNRVMGTVVARRRTIGLASVSERFLRRHQNTIFTHQSSELTGCCWIPNWWPQFTARVNEKNIPDGRRNAYIMPDSQR